MITPQRVADMVEAAILIERERCAKLVEEFTDYVHWTDKSGNLYIAGSSTVREIARRIRSSRREAEE